MSDEVLVRVPLDADTLEHLRQLALAERRATSDQAAVILTRALARRSRRQLAEAIR
jgi:hypothetical protein